MSITQQITLDNGFYFMFFGKSRWRTNGGTDIGSITASFPSDWDTWSCTYEPTADVTIYISIGD